MQDNYVTHLIIIILLTFVSINLFILDLKVFSPGSSVRLSEISTVATPAPTNPPSITPYPSVQTTINTVTYSQSAALVPREYYVPLGTGSTTSTSWENLTATETYIDTANYPGIKEAYFIASIRNPTQNGIVEAQLYNVTDKHPLWGSITTMSGRESQTITSNKITLESGNKLYRVQLKSSLSFLAYLDMAKIRLVTE